MPAPAGTAASSLHGQCLPRRDVRVTFYPSNQAALSLVRVVEYL